MMHRRAVFVCLLILSVSLYRVAVAEDDGPVIAAFEQQMEAFLEGQEAETAVGDEDPGSLPSTVEVVERPGRGTAAAKATEVPVGSEVMERDIETTDVARLKSIIRNLWEELRRQKRDNHYNMGCVYRECGLFGQAEKAFLAALELDPDDPGTHYNLGVLYEDDLKNAARARRHYEYFLQLAPGDPAAPEVRTWLMAL